MIDVSSSDTDPLLGTVAAHAALFTVEYALARLLLSWGIRPNVLLGHSVGELIAATVAGVFTLSDGIALLAARAKLIESVPVPGGMAAVAAGADEIAPLLAAEPLLSIAAINAPDRCVVSGASADLDRVGALLRERGHVVTPLAVSSAFHSPLMRDIAAELRDVVAGLDPREPEISVVSNLTGALAGPAELSDPDYWARHLCQPVNFVAGMRAVAERGRHAVIELGPSATLTTLARRCVPADGQLWLSCLRRGDETGQTLGDSLARLYAAGAKLDWAAVHGDGRDRRTALPTYAFERKRYWLPASGPPVRGAVAGDGHPLLGAPVDGHGTEFSVHVGTGRPAYLADHTAAGQAFLPAMLCVELALAVADVRHGHTRVPLTDIRFDTALPLADRLTELRITTTTRPDGRTEVAVSGRDAADGDWRRHASAVVGGGESISAPSPAGVALLRLLARPGEPTGEMDTEQVYAAYARADLDYGPEFRRAGRLVRYGGDLVVGEVRGSGVATGEHAPPPVLDAATHGLAMLADDGRRYISVGIAEVRVFRKPRAAVLRSVLRRVPAAGTDGIAFTVDALLLDGEQPVAELRGMAFRELTVPVMPSPAAGNGACQANAANSTENGTHRHTAIRDVIRTTVADLLRIDDPADIDEHATFLELGIDSLVGLQVKTVLENRFAVALRGSVVFDHPTTADLADFLDRMSHQGPRNENG
jgi:acyl transferase domain-containing protein